MKDYQPNSHRSKEEASKEKKIEKVVNGKVKTRKNEGRKLANMFISEDAGNIKSYVVLDVLVPAIKKAIADIVTGGIDMLFYDGGKGNSRNRSGSKVSYRSYYDDRRDYRDDRDDRDRYNSARRFDYDDIIFETRVDAERVREQMNDAIKRYGFVTIADMYDMADLQAPWTSANYGWTNIRTAETVRVYDGYIIKLPKAMPID